MHHHVLGIVGVLILIHHHVLKAVLVMLQHQRLRTEKRDCLKQEVVEIQGVLRQQLSLVIFIHTSDYCLSIVSDAPFKLVRPYEFVL